MNTNVIHLANQAILVLSLRLPRVYILDRDTCACGSFYWVAIVGSMQSTMKYAFDHTAMRRIVERPKTSRPQARQQVGMKRYQQ